RSASRGSQEADADLLGRTPSNMAAPFRLFLVHEKHEIVGNADWTFNFESGSSFREIANDAVGLCPAAKGDLSTFEGTVTGGLSLFFDGLQDIRGELPASKWGQMSAFVVAIGAKADIACYT